MAKLAFQEYSRAARAGVVVALGLMLGGCALTSSPSDTFGLSASPVVDGPSARGKQILIPEPDALKALDSEQIVIRVSGSEIQYLAKAQWSDKLPNVVQASLVEAFENSGKVGGVGKPGDGLAIDYQVMTSIRAFEVDAGSPSQAHVEISAKLLNDRTGTVKAQQVFSAITAVSGSDNAARVSALDRAFAKVTADMVQWTLKNL